MIYFYDDFSRECYYIVISKLLLPFLLLIINPHLLELVISWLLSVYMWFKNIFIKKASTFILNNQYKEFDLAYRFKNAMKLLMICFTFSSAIPILNISILLGLVFMFIFHKKIFITFSGKSPSYSSKIIELLIHQLKIIFILHCIMAMIFISNKDIFP